MAADDQKLVSLTLPETVSNDHVVQVLEKALEAAKRGELLDVVLAARVANEPSSYYHAWSRTTDEARRIGMIHMVLFDLMHQQG